MHLALKKVSLHPKHKRRSGIQANEQEAQFPLPLCAVRVNRRGNPEIKGSFQFSS